MRVGDNATCRNISSVICQLLCCISPKDPIRQMQCSSSERAEHFVKRKPLPTCGRNNKMRYLIFNLRACTDVS